MNFRFLIEYEELDLLEAASWAKLLGVSAPGASGEGVVSILTLS